MLRTAEASGLEPRLRSAQRVLEAPARRRNRRDDELFATLCAAVLREDSDCVDVGANAGHLLRHMVRLAPLGRHIAFEPVPDLAEALRREFPACDVREVALSDHRGEAEFVHDVHVPSLSGFPREGHRPEEERRFSVPVDTLDAALPPGFRPTLVKIDVEGVEMEVLTGARETLRDVRPVVAFEHGDAKNSPGVHTLFGEFGYAIFDMDGGGPYDAAGLAAAIANGQHWNWFARPRRSRATRA